MDALYYIFSWGSPLGLALFFFFSCAGVGILFWGLGQFNRYQNKQ
ncbi:hypothetical protein [Thalassotalea sp. LPB0316]|nr:hypothetical protein [Thalassotalea sp. LPB0316]